MHNVAVWITRVIARSHHLLPWLMRSNTYDAVIRAVHREIRRRINRARLRRISWRRISLLLPILWLGGLRIDRRRRLRSVGMSRRRLRLRSLVGDDLIVSRRF